MGTGGGMPMGAAATVHFTVNGQDRAVTTDPERPLLEVIREDLHLTGTKYGCGETRCGACSVLIDGKRALLVNAFKQRDSIRILTSSAAIGHYIADAHVPLHTTSNHNGQLTNQLGLHAFWESRLPELFASQYNFVVGKAPYIEDPLKEAWRIVSHTHMLVDSVLKLEARIHAGFPLYRKYSYSKRNNLLQRQYSEAYARAYHEAMNHMVEKQMRSAILMTGAYWYSAWIDAGQPTLENMKKTSLSAAERKESKVQEEKYKQGKIIGREN